MSMTISLRVVCTNRMREQLEQKLRRRHRRTDRSIKGSSVARLGGDQRKLRYQDAEQYTKYSGSYLKYIVRPKNGVGRPPRATLEGFI